MHVHVYTVYSKYIVYLYPIPLTYSLIYCTYTLSSLLSLS